MKRQVVLSIIISFFIINNSSAQIIRRDSITKVAESDAKKLKLTKTSIKSFRRNKNNSGSDIFKPTTETTSDVTLLNDSTYVQAFRAKAYAIERKRYNIWGVRGICPSPITEIAAIVAGAAIGTLCVIGFVHLIDSVFPSYH